ncbi:MAG: cbb3-type cytochrome c oxidase N-terminal domain-containing protein, partial [Bacteroidota bacterium]
MKSINKNFFALLLVMLNLLNHTPLLAAEGGYDLDKVMRVMLIVTLIVIAFVIWLAVVYSEKNDNEGKILKRPLVAFKNYLTKLTPLEKEKEILLDHNYDGIHELDHKIPPWFNFLFYGTIVWGTIYMLVFHVFSDGQVQLNEYKKEIQQAALEKQILIKSGALLSEETVTQLTDDVSISEGKEIYLKNCVSCHGVNGEGLVGPNLADD